MISSKKTLRQGNSQRRIFFLLGGVILFSLCSLQAAEWLNPGYRYRQRITISDGFYVTGADLKNFPLLIHLSDEQNPVFQKGKPDGSDLTFTTSDGKSKIPHELEKFSVSPAQLVCWVRLPFLYADQQTVIYLYYGNSNPPDPLPAESVWSEGYLGVWHFQDNTSLDTRPVTIKNSTGKGLAGKAPGNFIALGKFNQGTATSVSFTRQEGPDFTPETSFTAEAWVYCQEIPFRTTLSVLGKGSGGRGWSLYWHEAGRWQANITQDYRQENTRFYLMSPDSPWQKWRYLTVTYEALERKMRLFVDGLEKAAGRIPDGIKDFSVSSSFSIGGIRGVIDEVRLSSVARSPDWIATCAKNQSSPGRYIRFSLEEKFAR
ncbi:MAG: DUF2341 domain-containing protein [Candidatus Omnitrophica bacterium]|nr:DUF2341 domain-containing protein [Candidatus Omnitrophota bacterium]